MGGARGKKRKKESSEHLQSHIIMLLPVYDALWKWEIVILFFVEWKYDGHESQNGLIFTKETEKKYIYFMQGFLLKPFCWQAYEIVLLANLCNYQIKKAIFYYIII